jgi:Protein of unknown function (DUF3108)
MLAYCGRPSSASFCDRFPSIDPCYARETIAETCSIWVALATAIIGHSDSNWRTQVLTRVNKRRHPARPHSPRGSFRLALSSSLVVLALSLGAAAYADELKPFDASYEWIWHNMTVAVSTLHLERQGDTWVYRSKSEPRGIGRMLSDRPTLESVMKVTDVGVRPISYKADDGTSSTKRDANVQFDWEHNRMTGVNEDAKVDMTPIPPGIQDDLSVQIALMVELLRGHTPDKFSLLSGNSVREYHYSRDGEETLKTPVGTIPTIIYKSEKQYSPRITRFWCAPSLGYIPLRVQQTRADDVEWTMQVQSVKREQ